MTKKNTSNEEFQIVKSWLQLDNPLGIVTHIDVDADAVFSAALLQTLRPYVPVHFVQANFEIETDEAIAVDMLNGPRAVKGLSYGSAFGLLVAAIKKP